LRIEYKEIKQLADRTGPALSQEPAANILAPAGEGATLVS